MERGDLSTGKVVVCGLFLLTMSVVSCIEPGNQSSEQGMNYSSPEAGRLWMIQTNEKGRFWGHLKASAEWNFTTNITKQTQDRLTAVTGEKSEWLQPRQAEGRKFKVQNFDRDLRRQFQAFTLSGDPRDFQKVKEKSQLHTEMMTTYNTAKVCLPNTTTNTSSTKQGPANASDQCLPLEPDLQKKMAESRDPAELKAVWEGWRRESRKGQRQRYQRYVQLLNEGARDNGFKDYSDYWTEAQFPDHTDLEAMTSSLWAELRPLYLQLHAYVRGRLRQKYGQGIVGTDGTIPAHLLGNMWAQEWGNIFPLVTPYPQNGSASDDIDHRLQQRYDVHGLFKLAEKFYADLGLPNMTAKFWNYSMLEKPADREVQCHPSAHDLLSRGDFRIKMCTSVDAEYLSTIHHEMGHIQFYMAYEDQPTIFRNSANQAFHEAVGDTTTLSVMSRAHLQKLGLVSNDTGHAKEKEINDLMKMALHKIAFLPFAQVVDGWRWRVFRGQTTVDTYNRDWWNLRLDLQGLRSPVPRSEKNFDAAAKMHVMDNAPYYCYFISHVAQFQFYKTLCEASGHTGPLHLCDFDGSHKAGTRFRNFMALGASRPWPEALASFTGSRNITAQPMLDYFAPLRQWLESHNAEHNETLGWENATINWDRA